MIADTDRIGADGYAVVADVLDAAAVEALIAALSFDAANVRNLLAVPAVAAVAASAAVRAIVEPVLGAGARPVRGILFDKTPAANWRVPWHQDVSIAVRRRVADAAGYGPWSVKAGVAHVQPPAAVLADMITVRLHLDDCGADNGPLPVVPGSHADGVLDAADIGRWRASVPEAVATVGRGGAVVMRPLVLHASSPAVVPGRRRVVHVEFAGGGPLPGWVEWAVDS